MQFQDVHSGYPLKGEGVKVTSCLVTSEELARRGQHINIRWPGWSSLGGHKWSTLSGHRGLSATLGDRDDSLSRFGLDGNEQIGGAVAHVLVVLLGWVVLLHGQRLAAVADKLQALLVNANYWLCLGYGARVQFEQSVHAGTVFLGQLPDAPHHPAPGLEIVFLSMRRTVSRLTDCMPGS